MKLHSIQIHNLNALYGEHAINLQDDLDHAPLFLIMGPTGAGKSTILDAICLALFGQTPRLRGDRGRPETDPSLAMSHGTASCKATVVFSKRESDGVRRQYRAEWSCRRARNKPTGKPQSPHRSLTRLHPGGHEEILASDDRAKHVDSHFNEVLEGLTVQDFKRSVLLAQGEFAAFLSATKDEKASILERLTNTDEYKKIGERAGRRFKAIEKQKEQIETKLKSMELLRPEEEQELVALLVQEKQEHQRLHSELEILNQSLQWLKEKQKRATEVASALTKQQDALQALEKGQTDQERLREHDRCRELLPELSRVQDHEQNLTLLEQQQKQCLHDKEKAEARFLQATEEYAQAQVQLSATEQAWEQAQPVLEEAQRRTGMIENIQNQCTQYQQQWDEWNKKKQKQDKEARKNQTAWEEAQRTWNQAQEVYQKLLALGDLEKKLPVWENLTTSLAEKSEKYKEIAVSLRELEQTQQDLERKQRELQKKQTSWQERQATQEETYQAAQTALQTLLGQAPDRRTFRAEKQTERTTLEQQQKICTERLRLHQMLRESLHQIQAKDQILAEIRTELAQLHQEQSHDTLQLQSQEALLHEQNLHLDTLKRILALVDERATLADHQPCPLCGSEHHPFRESGNIAEKEASFVQERDALQKQIQDTKKTISKLTKSKEQRDTQRIRREEHLQQHQDQKDKSLATLTEAEQDWDLSWNQAVRFPRSPEEQDVLFLQLETQQTDLVAKIADIDQLLEQVEECQQRLDQAEKARQQAQQDKNKLDVEAATLQERMLQQSANQSLRQKEKEEHRTALQKVSAGLREQYEAMGWKMQPLSWDELDKTADAIDKNIAELISFDAAKTLESAQEHQKTLTQAQENQQQAWDTCQTLEPVLLENKRQCEDIERMMTQVKEQKHAAETERQGQEKQLERLLSGKTLQAFRASRQDPMIAAKKQVEDKKKQVDSAQKIHVEKQAEWQARTQSITTTRKQLDDALASLNQGMQRLQLNFREQLVAKLLSPEDYEHLQKQAEVRQDLWKQATYQHEAASRALQEHLAVRPGSLEEEDISVWMVKAEQTRQQEAECNKKIGVIEDKQKRQQEAVKKNAQLVEEQQTILETWKIWKTIYELVGRKDGDSFKLFAQSLNLQELVIRANDRLNRLAPRYRLTVAKGEEGEPLLDFKIKDREQAEDERPITTLSGGETFLVSLALALALADFRRIAMPIETLLLDEGFGTLDQDTLDLVMQTLRQLQQESDQQIGLISHVEALKERIDAQIWVEKRGNGRSAIRISAPHRRASSG